MAENKINTAEGENALAWGLVLFIVLAGPNSVSLMSSDVLHFLISHLVSADVSVYCTLWQVVCVCVCVVSVCYMPMHVFVNVCMHVCVHAYICGCMHIYMCVFVCAHMPEINPRTLLTINSYTIWLAQINFQVWRLFAWLLNKHHSQMNIVIQLEILNIFWSSLIQWCLVAVCQRTILWKIEFSTPVEFCTLSDKKVPVCIWLIECEGSIWREMGEGGREESMREPGKKRAREKRGS